MFRHHHNRNTPGVHYDSPPTISHLYNADDVVAPPHSPDSPMLSSKQALDEWNEYEMDTKIAFLECKDIPANLIKCSKCGGTPSTRACTCCGIPYCSYYCLKDDWNVHSRSCSVVEYTVEDEPKRNTQWGRFWGWLY